MSDLLPTDTSPQLLQSLAAFVQLNPNPVLQFSGDGQLSYFNDAASEMARSLGQEHPAAMLPPETPTILQTCLATGQRKLRVEASMGGRRLCWSFFPIKQSQTVHCYI